MLEFSPNEGNSRDTWFKIISKKPQEYESPYKKFIHEYESLNKDSVHEDEPLYKKSIIVKRYLEHMGKMKSPSQKNEGM